MPDTPLGMGPQDAQERERFEGEVKRIVAACDGAGVTLRVLGSLAFQTHCPKFGYLQAARLAKEAMETKQPIKDLAIKNGILTIEEANQLFDLENISKNRYQNHGKINYRSP